MQKRPLHKNTLRAPVLPSRIAQADGHSSRKRIWNSIRQRPYTKNFSARFRGYQSNWLTLNIGGRSYGVSKNRLYDMELGIFLSRDPLIDLRNSNRYSYSMPNPIQFLDSEGLTVLNVNFRGINNDPLLPGKNYSKHGLGRAPSGHYGYGRTDCNYTLVIVRRPTIEDSFLSECEKVCCWEVVSIDVDCITYVLPIGTIKNTVQLAKGFYTTTIGAKEYNEIVQHEIRQFSIAIDSARAWKKLYDRRIFCGYARRDDPRHVCSWISDFKYLEEQAEERWEGQKHKAFEGNSTDIGRHLPESDFRITAEELVRPTTPFKLSEPGTPGNVSIINFKRGGYKPNEDPK